MMFTFKYGPGGCYLINCYLKWSNFETDIASFDSMGPNMAKLSSVGSQVKVFWEQLTYATDATEVLSYEYNF